MSRAARSAGRGALGLALALGCATPAFDFDFTALADGRLTAWSTDGLQRVPAAQVGALYVRPGVELWRYDAVVVDPVALFYRSPPNLTDSSQGQPGTYRLRPDAADRVRRTVREALERELSRIEGIGLASEPETGTLRVSGSIVDFVWEAPPPRGGESYYLKRTGATSLVVAVRDSETGEVLVRLADRRLIRPVSSGVPGGYESSAVNNWTGVREVSATWARMLRESLEALLSRLPVPTPA